MFNFRKLLGSQSQLADVLIKEMEQREKETLLQRVDYLYGKYKTIAEQSETLEETRRVLKDLWLTIDMVIAEPAEEEDMADNMEGMQQNGMWMQQQEKQESAEGTSPDSTETDSPSDAVSSETAKSSESEHSGIIIFKDANGKNRWMGIVSNNFTDRHAEILSKEAHLDFVKAVRNGEYPYPDLQFHHQDFLVIGKSDYVNFDEESGMLLASGYFLDEFEEIGDNLSTSKSAWGMSHGMPQDEIRKMKNNKRVYSRYRSKEFTLLKLEKAANPLTSFS